MKQVTMKITPQGWEIVIEIDGVTTTNRTKLTKFGAQGIDEPFEENEDLEDDLVSALDDVSSRAYDVARALQRMDD